MADTAIKPYKIPKNPQTYHLFQALLPALQEWVRQMILAPISTPEGEGFGRNELYPKIERSIEYDMGHWITINIDLSLAADCIEEGRRAGKMPPVAAIQRWLVVKRVVPKHDTTIEQLNFLIRRKIGREGTVGKHYLQEQIDKTPFDWLDDRIDQIIDEYFEAFEIITD